MRDTIFIYGLCHPVTSELRYIGKTNNLKVRLSTHLADCTNPKKGRSYSAKWLRGLLAEGLLPEMFVVEECTAGTWEESECFHIQYFRSLGCRLANHTAGGEGGFCPEVSRREAAKRVGVPLSEEHKKKISQGNIGRVFDEETRRKIGEAHKGRVCTEEARRNMSLSHMGKPSSRKGKPGKASHIGVYRATSPSGEVVEFENLSAFCRERGWKPRSIHNAMNPNKPQKTYKGLVFERCCETVDTR